MAQDRGTPGPGSSRTVRFQPEALEDLRYRVRQDRKIAERVLELVESARRDPFRGIGKPEPLGNLGSDVWSRRITKVDRLVYRVLDGTIDILQARYHY